MCHQNAESSNDIIQSFNIDLTLRIKLAEPHKTNIKHTLWVICQPKADLRELLSDPFINDSQIQLKSLLTCIFTLFFDIDANLYSNTGNPRLTTVIEPEITVVSHADR